MSCVCWIDDAAAASLCSRPVLVAAVSRSPPSATSTSTPLPDSAVAGPASSVLSDSARQAGQAGQSTSGHHGQDTNLSSFNSSTLRSMSPNSRIRKQPEMPPLQFGEFSTSSGSSVRWSIWNVRVVMVMLSTVSISDLALLNYRCQRLTSS